MTEKILSGADIRKALAAKAEREADKAKADKPSAVVKTTTEKS